MSLFTLLCLTGLVWHKVKPFSITSGWGFCRQAPSVGPSGGNFGVPQQFLLPALSARGGWLRSGAAQTHFSSSWVSAGRDDCSSSVELEWICHGLTQITSLSGLNSFSEWVLSCRSWLCQLMYTHTQSSIAGLREGSECEILKKN